MRDRWGLTVWALAVGVAAASPARAQTPDEFTVIDSIAVQGADRVGRAFVESRVRIPIGSPSSYRDVTRAIEELYATGQFEDIEVWQQTVGDEEVLIFRVKERPLLTRWTVSGTEKLSDRSVRGKVRLVTGRPVNPSHITESVSRIDSLYQKEGYYRTEVNVVQRPQPDGSVQVEFAVNEGPRVAISEIVIEGNEQFSDDEIVGQMKTGPEGFFWFKTGEYDDQEVQADLRERIPAFYAHSGFIDFQVTRDTLIINRETGKATLIISVDEGDQYEVGTFESIGNRHYTDDQIKTFYPFREDADEGGGFLGFGGGDRWEGRRVFDRQAWEDAAGEVASLYYNSGYIRADVEPQIHRRTAQDGTKIVDLRWQITEGAPAIVRQVRVTGNTVTHENVIRQAILVIPGDVFRQDALIQSYQRVQNLGFFEQPMDPPNIVPANNQGDVDIIFNVEERHTGNINFGASVGQGTGVGGFIGLDEPNMLGRGKRVSFQWQFGANINDFNVTYSDPSLRGSLISGSVNLHRTRQRFTVADLGRITATGGSVQLGFPLFGSRFTRIITSYTLEQSNYDTPTLISRFQCTDCLLSSVGVSLVRDTRVGLPFATGGTMHNVELTQTGGILGGSGNFQRATFEGRWYAPLNSSTEPTGPAVQFVLGLTAKAGFVWGDPGPHFRSLFSMGGTQFGIPLRGYDEFSITPQGFDPTAQGLQVNTVAAFGQSYAAFTAEIGMRLSQMLYFNTFMDGGNVWARPEQFNPTRLFRGAGVGLSILSPLGPIGLDYAYGFDRKDANGDPDPGWKFHFKIGNFF